MVDFRECRHEFQLQLFESELLTVCSKCGKDTDYLELHKMRVYMQLQLPKPVGRATYGHVSD